MNEAIAAARRMVANNRKPGDPIEYAPEDGLAVARYLLSLADARDDLVELAEIAGRADEAEAKADADTMANIEVTYDLLRARNAALSALDLALGPETALRLIHELRMRRSGP